MKTCSQLSSLCKKKSDDVEASKICLDKPVLIIDTFCSVDLLVKHRIV